MTVKLSVAKLAILSIFCAVLGSAQTATHVTGVTATSAILEYDAPSFSLCTVEVSRASTFTPVVPDVDEAAFTGKSADITRPSTVAKGLHRTVVVGAKSIATAGTGVRYSLALQASTQHFYRITCGATSASGNFTTASIPLGATSSIPPFVDPATPGAIMHPTLNASLGANSATRNGVTSTIVDPYFGSLVKQVSAPGDHTESTTFSTASQYTVSPTTCTCGRYHVWTYSTNGNQHYAIDPVTGAANYLGIVASSANLIGNSAFNATNPHLSYRFSGTSLQRGAWGGTCTNETVDQTQNVADLTTWATILNVSTGLTTFSASEPVEKRFSAAFAAVASCIVNQVSGTNLQFTCRDIVNTGKLAWLGVVDLNAPAVTAAMPQYSAPATRWCGYGGVANTGASNAFAATATNALAPYVTNLSATITAAATALNLSSAWNGAWGTTDPNFVAGDPLNVSDATTLRWINHIEPQDYLQFADGEVVKVLTATTTIADLPPPKTAKVFDSTKYSHANTRYVSSTAGSDNNNGTTLALAWQTIGKAIGTSPANTLIRVQPGTYVNPNGNITGKSNISIVGDTTNPANRPFLQATSTAINQVIFIQDSNNIVIDNLRIRGFNSGNRFGSPIFIKMTSSGQTHHITIRNCDIEAPASAGNGIHVFGGEGRGGSALDYLTFEDNTIHGIPGAEPGGWRNDQGPSGISVFEPARLDTAAGPHIIFRRNFIYHFGQGHISSGIGQSIVSDGNGILMCDGCVETFSNARPAYDQRIDAYDNIIVFPGGDGLTAFWSPGPFYVYNNTVYRPGRCRGMGGADAAGMVTCGSTTATGTGNGSGWNSNGNGQAINARVWNNTFVLKGGTGTNNGTHTEGGGICTADYNHSFGVSGNSCTGTHDKTGTDPLFGVPATNSTNAEDWTPANASPLNGGGVASFSSVTGVTTDYDLQTLTAPPPIGAQLPLGTGSTPSINLTVDRVAFGTVPAAGHTAGATLTAYCSSVNPKSRIFWGFGADPHGKDASGGSGTALVPKGWYTDNTTFTGGYGFWGRDFSRTALDMSTVSPSFDPRFRLIHSATYNGESAYDDSPGVFSYPTYNQYAGPANQTNWALDDKSIEGGPNFTAGTFGLVSGTTTVYGTGVDPAVFYTAGGTGTWTNRKKLVIDHTKVAGDLVDFPMLLSATDVTWKTVVNGGFVGNAGGTDMVFTASDGVTKLAHEIDSYTATSGNLVAWIKIPALSSTVDTVVYVYYGNAGVANQQNKTGVWSSGYVLAAHLSQSVGGAGAILDSSPGVHNGTNTGSVTLNQSGIVGPAVTFAGGYIDFGSISVTGATTISGWMFPTASGQVGRLLNRQDATGGWSIEMEANNFAAAIFDPALNDGLIKFTNSNPTVPAINAWHYVVGVFEPSTAVRLYLDGVYVSANTTTISATHASPAINVRLGNRPDCCAFTGRSDEPRIATAARNAAWVTTEYNNQNAPGSFLSVVATVAATTLAFTPKMAPSVLAMCGSHVLADVSHPNLGNTLTDADPYTYCIAAKAGECRTGSLKNQVFIACPGRTSTTCGFSGEDICLAPMAPLAGTVAQVGVSENQREGLRDSDTSASQTFVGSGYSRPLTRAWRNYRSGNLALTAKALPDASWALTTIEPGRQDLAMVKLAAWPAKDTIDRTGYIPTAVTGKAPITGTAVKAVVDFGYNPLFYCMGRTVNFAWEGRQEQCSSVATTQVINADDPFFYASETITPAACAGTCTLYIPAISQAVLYYRWRFFDVSNVEVHRGPTNVMVTP